jgi:hypothetical protein
MGIQCDKVSDYHALSKEKLFEMVSHTRIYYPEFNIEN